jgi:hypothetical protein
VADIVLTFEEFCAKQKRRIQQRIDARVRRVGRARRARTRSIHEELDAVERLGAWGFASAIGPKRKRLDQLDGDYE